MGMVAMGLVITYNSYQSLVFTHEIKQPLLTMMVLSLASAISFYNAYQMRTIANKYNSIVLPNVCQRFYKKWFSINDKPG